MAISYQPGPGGSRTLLNISAPTQVKSGQGYVYRVRMIVEPTANGAVYDMATGGTPSVANQIAVIPYQPGNQEAYTVEIHAPFFEGLYIDPGTSGTVTVSYD